MSLIPLTSGTLSASDQLSLARQFEMTAKRLPDEPNAHRFALACKELTKFGTPGFERIEFDQNNYPLLSSKGFFAKVFSCCCTSEVSPSADKTVKLLIDFFNQHKKFFQLFHVPGIQVVFKIKKLSPAVEAERQKFHEQVTSFFWNVHNSFVTSLFNSCEDETRFDDTSVPVYGTEPLLGKYAYREFALEPDELKAFCMLGRMIWANATVDANAPKIDVKKTIESSPFLWQPLLNMRSRLEMFLKQFSNGVFFKSYSASPKDARITSIEKQAVEERIWPEYEKQYGEIVQEIFNNQMVIGDIFDTLEMLKGTVDDMREFLNANNDERVRIMRKTLQWYKETKMTLSLDLHQKATKKVVPELPKRGYKRPVRNDNSENVRTQDNLSFYTLLLKIARPEKNKALNGYFMRLTQAIERFNKDPMIDSDAFSNSLKSVLDAIEGVEYMEDIGVEAQKEISSFIEKLKLTPEKLTEGMKASKWFKDHPGEVGLLGAIERDVTRECRPKPFTTVGEVLEKAFSFRLYMDAESRIKNGQIWKLFFTEFCDEFDLEYRVMTNRLGNAIALSGITPRETRACSTLLPGSSDVSLALSDAADAFLSKVTAANDESVDRDVTLLDHAIPGKYARDYVQKMFRSTSKVVADEISEYIKLDVVMELGIRINYFASLKEWEVKFIEVNTGFWPQDVRQMTDIHYWLWTELHILDDSKGKPKILTRISNICLGAILASSSKKDGKPLILEDFTTEIARSKKTEDSCKVELETSGDAAASAAAPAAAPAQPPIPDMFGLPAFGGGLPAFADGLPAFGGGNGTLSTKIVPWSSS